MNKKIDGKNTSVSYYLKNMRNNFTVDLDYKYSVNEKQSIIEKWIEAVSVGIPGVDGTFSAIKENGKYKIIDGQKRLTAINDFVDGKIKCHGKSYSELSEEDRQNFLMYPLSFTFFDESVKKEIFMKRKFKRKGEIYMVKYRPHKGNLGNAMEKEVEFKSVEEMFAYIVKEWENWSGKTLFEIGDLSLSEDKGKDERVDWKETRYICTKRIGEEIYDTPQCIGMCSIE